MSFNVYSTPLPEPRGEWCDYCGRPYTCDIFLPGNLWLCEQCFWDYLQEDDRATEVAEALDIPCRKV